MTVPPSDPSQQPVLAGAYELRKAAAINELLTIGAAVLPREAGHPILPFEVGIFSQFQARLRPDVPKVKLRRALGAYASSRHYLRALAQPDAMRHDIDGTPRLPVSAGHRTDAQARTDTLSEHLSSLTTPTKPGV